MAKRKAKKKMKSPDKHQQGKCPKCGSEMLTYGETELQDNSLGYRCFCQDCDYCGIEWYDLVFTNYEKQ
jgi:hypothetical protein